MPSSSARVIKIVAQAARHNLVTLAGIRDIPAAGGLMSYGPSLVDQYRQAGIYAGKILKGASEVIAASAEQRQEAYTWLFKTRNMHKQDVRIRMLIEEDAFNRLLENWKRQGYPFGHLVPSLATAIGSSGDRPDALATLMGIILNGGVRQPTTDIVRLHFAADTPYETEMVYRAEVPERVMSSPVAATLRRALVGVVENGTGSRVRRVYTGSDGMPVAIGGKTGTGDNRFETFASGHRLVEARAVDRTATFVFFLADRIYGTVTAYVPGQDADRYHFTSALAVSLLKALEPEIRPLLESPPVDGRVVEAVSSQRHPFATGANRCANTAKLTCRADLRLCRHDLRRLARELI